jgi:hypothetical protein
MDLTADKSYSIFASDCEIVSSKTPILKRRLEQTLDLFSQFDVNNKCRELRRECIELEDVIGSYSIPI